MLFSDSSLARRLERMEGNSCVSCAVARRRIFPSSGATWMERAGAYAVFDGVDSPVTQTFGLGMFEEATHEALDDLERFFSERGALVAHEVCPFAGTRTLARLCERGYRPIEINTVLSRPIERAAEPPKGIEVHAIAPDEIARFSEVCARGWSDEHPELRAFLLELGAVLHACEETVCFLATLDGEPGAAGVLHVHEKIALFGGAATVPELRRRGLQGALLQARMRHAEELGCDVAMMVAELGSQSQRNAERNGFRVAYTRTKWLTR